ncbi:MAG: zinc metallopeptidase [Planctomycetota bacterium]
MIMPGLYDWTLALLVPGVILGIYAQAKVRSSYARFSKVMSRRGVTGAHAARALLQVQGITVYPDAETAASAKEYGIAVDRVGGQMTDHFDPRHKVIRLSDGVYHGNSLAALGIAAHEAGHAIQHTTGYLPVMIRSGIYPLVALSNYLWMILFFAGIFMSYPPLITIGIYLFAAIVAFQIITLPTEFNASKRALALLTEHGIVTGDERASVKKVLDAAALTYVAATLMAVLQLIRLILISRDRR